MHGLPDETFRIAMVLSFVVLTFGVVRAIRIALLEKEAKRTLLRVECRSTDAAQERGTLAEGTVLASITCVDYMLGWASIDPAIIRAVDSASEEHIRNGWDLANYIHAHLSALSEPAKEGAINRLLGYVGEQKVAAILSEQGHLVEMADKANQPIWDLLVDGNMVNVKTVSDIASIQDIASQHPDVTFVVPEDANGEAVGNIVKLEGFGYEDTKNSLHEAVSQATGEPALNSLLYHIPWVTISATLYRRFQSIRAGQALDSALRMAGIELICNTAGVCIGGKIGAASGSLFGPLGTLIGTIAGAVLGRIVGGEIATELKLGKFRTCMTEFEQALSEVGRIAAQRIDRLYSLAWQPCRRIEQGIAVLSNAVRTRKRSVKQLLWPDFLTILLRAALKQGYARRQEYEQIAWDTETKLRNLAETGQYTKLGMIVVNTPSAYEAIDCSVALRNRVENTYSRVQREREQLKYLRA